MALTDRYLRSINYVRISITDRCNLRCRYCMPEDGVPLLDHKDILSYEEIFFLCEVLRGLGVRKIRFTGGEPLVRRGFLDFLSSLKEALPNLKIALTTNGVLLLEQAERIAKIGISGLNVSLDTLNPYRFRYITRNGDLTRVLDGMALARKAGLRSIKVNTVIIRHFNDDEIPDLLDFCAKNDYLLRLIEFMPMDEKLWQKDSYIPAQEILDSISCGGIWIPYATEEEITGPARYYQNPQSGQRIGIISAVSSHFCSLCNRIRVSASGGLRACLFAKAETNLRELLAARDKNGLVKTIVEAVTSKPRCWEDVASGELHMSQIGG